MVKTAALVTVRTGSSRLPGKVLLPVYENKTALDVLIERVKKTGLEVIICTSEDPSDQILDISAQKNNVKIFRGNLKHKIKRWESCFRTFNLEAALLVDGDDLLYDGGTGMKALNHLISNNLDMVKQPENIVCGLFTYAISKSGIEKLLAVSENHPDTDVITEFIDMAGLNQAYVPLEEWQKDKAFRLTLDYPEDLLFFRELFKQISYLADGKDVIGFLDKKPEIAAINLFRQNDFIQNQQRFNTKIRKGMTRFEAEDLQGERVLLTKLAENHLEDMHEYLSMPEFFRHMEYSHHRTMDETRDYFNKLMAKVEQGAIYWAIVLKENNKMIGSLGVRNIDSEEMSGEFGIGISPSYWDSGISAEVQRICLSHCFNVVGLKSVWAVTSVEHQHALNSLKRLGFKEEKLLPAYYRKYDGRVYDAYKYVLKSGDFLSHSS